VPCGFSTVPAPTARLPRAMASHRDLLTSSTWMRFAPHRVSPKDAAAFHRSSFPCDDRLHLGT
jgi:hypothetical protein